VAARACDLAARHHLDLSRTLAVAWRGTDKKTEATVIPIERYFPVIDRLLREEPDLVLFSKPEEEGVLAALRSRYPLVTFPGFFLARTGEEQMADRVNPASGYERGMQAALLIYFYSQAKYLLRNASSLADVAAFLSAGTVIQVEKSC
jgi:hypothetical protein